MRCLRETFGSCLSQAFDFSISIATRTTSREQALYGKIKQVPVRIEVEQAMELGKTRS